MNILLAHNNFPGQFHRLAVELAADPANKVLFLSQLPAQGSERAQGGVAAGASPR